MAILENHVFVGVGAHLRFNIELNREESIRAIAFDSYCKREWLHLEGTALDDWLKAEKEYDRSVTILRYRIKGAAEARSFERQRNGKEGTEYGDRYFATLEVLGISAITSS